MINEHIQSIIARLNPPSILIGFSGGPDSTALLLAVTETTPLPVTAAHFNHGIRGETANDEAEWCRRFCARRNIPFELVEFDTVGKKQGGESIEAAARRLRLDGWRRLRRQHPGAAIALAHHADDRVENLFLGLSRGANSSGMTGLRGIRVIDGLTIIHPLLPFRKAELEAYLRKKGVDEWLHDASNDDNHHLRNFIRNRVIPLLKEHSPGAEMAFKHAADNIETDADFIERTASAEFAAIDGGTLDAARLIKLHPALRVRIWRKWLSRRLGREWLPNRQLIARLETTLDDSGNSGETRRVPISGATEVAFQGGGIFIAQREQSPGQVRWNWKNEERKTFGRFIFAAEIIDKDKALAAVRANRGVIFAADSGAMPPSVTIRPWRDGDRMTPSHRNSPVKIKKLLTDHGVIGRSRENYPTITAGDDEIIWLPGIARSKNAMIPDDAARALVIRMMKR